MFFATLFTTARTWNQSKCPSTEEWIKKMWSIYTMEYYSTMKMNEMMLFAATWMQLEGIILSEVSERKTNISWYHLHVESKIWHKWTYLWNINRLTDIENRLVIAKAVGVGGMVQKIEASRGKLLHIEWINNKVLLYKTENYIQYHMINLEKNISKKNVLYITESLYCTAVITILYINHTWIFKIR